MSIQDIADRVISGGNHHEFLALARYVKKVQPVVEAAREALRAWRDTILDDHEMSDLATALAALEEEPDATQTQADPDTHNHGDDTHTHDHDGDHFH